jgi:undecaprenyl-diphosphatase
LILLTVTVALVAAAAAYACVRRWPGADPASPRGRWVTDEVRTHPPLAAFLRRRTDPTTATGLALTLVIVAIAGAAVVVGVLLAMIRSETGLADVDVRAARWASEQATAGSTRFLRALTHLGGSAGVAVLAVLVAVAARRAAPVRSVVAFLVVVIAGQNLLVNTVKWLVDRARPDLDPLGGYSGPSFPSGHSATAAAAFAAFALVLGRRRSLGTKALLAGGAAGVATAVAATRVLLGVHWFTDVVAGLVMGWAWFAVCSIAFGGRLLRFGAPVERGVDEATPAPSA